MSENTEHEPIPQREKFPVKFSCLKCGQVGSATWEENAEVSPKGPMPLLLGVSSGFYQRMCEPHTGSMEIVCGVCESVVPD
jgi:hypothetical protein